MTELTNARGEPIRNIPHCLPTDRWHTFREDAKRYAGILSRDEVLRVTNAIHKFRKSEKSGPVEFRRDGVNVKRWKRDGFKEGMDHARRLLVSSYLEHATFEELFKHWSMSGAMYRMESILTNLRYAIDLGIWTEDGSVREFDPENPEGE